MDKLKEKFEQVYAPVAQQIKDLIKDHGSQIIGHYSIEQVYHGMKGMIGMVEYWKDGSERTTDAETAGRDCDCRNYAGRVLYVLHRTKN